MENTAIKLYDLASDIAELCDDSHGVIDTELKYGDIYVIVRGEYRIYDYQEDDYYTGTGAWVVTDAQVDIEELLFCNEEGEEINIKISFSELERAIEDTIKTF
jgi:hypothetical protein